MHFGGCWLLTCERPGIDPLAARIGRERPPGLAFATDELGEWDSGLVAPLLRLVEAADEAGVAVDVGGLPGGACRLLRSATEVPERADARRRGGELGFLGDIGRNAQQVWDLGVELTGFTGKLVVSLRRYLGGRANWRVRDLWVYVQEAGAEALPIVSLIGFLIGMIFAFVGAYQLQAFGAGIYTANLVAIGMVREMGPIMTGIIMAGRTGAAYAAQIGTMRVNEEVDALSTLGIDPIDFLVTPRVIALVIMMPLLSLYGSFMGILGGMLVGVTMVDVSLPQYVAQTLEAVDLSSLLGGLFKAIVYGALVAIAGCQQGLTCGGSAMAVGQSTTRAVVMGIVLIVISASVLTVIYTNFGI